MRVIEARLKENKIEIQSKIETAIKLGRKRPKSDVWDNFGQLYDKVEKRLVSNYAICMKCQKLIGLYGANTTVMKRHLCINFPSVKKFAQVKSTSFVKSDAQKIKQGCISFCVNDIRPFYAVEGKGMIDILEQVMLLGQKYPYMNRSDLERIIPTANTVKSDIMKAKEVVVQDIKMLFRQAIEFSGGFCISTDIWTDKYRHRSYICLTAHMHVVEDNNLVLKNLVIHMNVVPEMSKTGEVVEYHVLSALQKYDITLEEIKKCATFVHDRGGNVRLGLKDYNQIFCFAHMLNNLVRKMCQTQEEVADIIQNASKLVQYCKRTGLINHIVENGGTTLQSYCETRWNTVIIMLDSIVHNYHRIVNALAAKEASDPSLSIINKVTCLDKSSISKICDFLRVFKNMTEEISGEKYGTIHKVWMMIEKVHKALTFNINDFNMVAEMKEIGKNYLNTDRSKKDFAPTIEHKLGVFLHPMMKSLKLMNFVEKEKFLKQVDEMVLSMNVATTPASESNATNNVQHEENYISTFLDDISENENRTSDVYHNELKQYIEHKLPKDTKFATFVLEEWWWKHRQIFPTLSKIFFKNNSITATSTPSERAFSTGGNIITEKRSQLCPEAIESIFILRNKRET